MKKKKVHLLQTIYISISLLMSAVVYNIFLLPLSLVTGGTGGVATITHYVFGFDPAIMIFLISAACVVLSFLYIGKERTMGTILACLIYPILVKLTSPLNSIIAIEKTDMFLVIIFASVLNGISNGLMYKSGYSSGGLPILSQILFEKFKIPISKSSLLINVIIILIGAKFFGTTNALYAIIFLYINNLVLDRVLLGISNNKAFYIITTKEVEVKDFIIKNLNHTATIFDVKGGYEENNKKVILTVIPSREYYKTTEGIKLIDKDAFF
ncbi:MAG: YitT family protein, partial [Bacilli bacterium]|nr:YitT family protein [Bacilli bacterium]